MPDYHRYICPKCGHTQYSVEGRYACPFCRSIMKCKDQKRRRKTPVVLWVIFLLVLLSSLALRAYNDSGGTLRFTLPNNLFHSDPADGSGPALSLPSSSPSLSFLAPTQDLHQTLLDGLRERASSITVKGFDVKEIKDETKAILREHPELFWLSGSFTYRTKTTDFGTWIEVLPDFYDTENIPQKELELNRILQDIASMIPEETPDYEKALFIHDYIVNTTDYDHDAAGKNVFSDSSSAYGCLVRHKAVCGGYAKAYKLLMDHVGISCGYVTGDIIGRGLHAWNYITVGGVSAFVDVTWDDAVFEDSEETEGICSHEYYCVTEQELSRTHVPDLNQNVPACDSTSLDYFRQYGYYYDEPNMDDIIRAILSSPLNTWVELKFSTPELQAAVSRDLFEDRWMTYYGYTFLQAGVQVTYSSKQTSQILKVCIY